MNLNTKNKPFKVSKQWIRDDYLIRLNRFLEKAGIKNLNGEAVLFVNKEDIRRKWYNKKPIGYDFEYYPAESNFGKNQDGFFIPKNYCEDSIVFYYEKYNHGFLYDITSKNITDYENRILKSKNINTIEKRKIIFY
ncbi:hypothetical protein SCLARK_001335 [Spiroplasma clarkii]|uniref:hypothetical protein n=1 Tax=Spiroplasma clarkii TaxID=2139 RepID=UPI000B566EDE|nr:hypothetical protein [Spiroplasma clarkii]ARU91868.1 hypothetical protein SCLARK_001335 [Spiroplasma clarkii]